MLLEEVKNYLRIDGSEDDMLLTSFITAAKQYIYGSTGVYVDDTDQLHLLALKILISHWYDNREPVGKADNLAFSLESIVTQIKYVK
jgi:uncharacterized phage protein (predicted DNA packaging)